MCYVIDWTSVGRDLLLSNVRDDSPLKHDLELFNVLVVRLVVYLMFLLADLTIFGFLVIVNKHSRILLEWILGL